MDYVRKLARHYRNELGLLVAIVAVIVVTMWFNDAYLRKPALNTQEILKQTALLGIFTLGAAVVIIAGGIDLSSGSVIALSGSVCGAIIYALAPLDEAGDPDTQHLSFGVMAIAILGTLLVGFFVGTFHAWLITVIGLPPFVATLASLVGLRSFSRVFVKYITRALTATGESTQFYVRDRTFLSLADGGETGDLWWIPLAIFLVMAALAWLLMSRTVVGRHLYALGGNEAAARLSGIRTDRLKWLAYCLSSMTASVAGVLYFAEVGQVSPDTQGLGYELNAIAAAVVGGCSLQGGSGLIPGAVLGVLFLRLVIDAVGKIVKANSDDYQGLIVGLLVVLAVAFNELRERRGTGKQFFAGLLGALSILILAGLGGAMAAVMSTEGARGSLRWGGIVFATIAVILGLWKFFESRGSRSKAGG